MSTSQLQEIGLTNWNAQMLGRFCEIGYNMALRKFKAVLDGQDDLTHVQRTEILEGLEKELDVVTENLILVALNYGHLKSGVLKSTEEGPRARRSLMLTEEDE